MRSFAGERPPPPIASAPSSSDRRLKGHRDLREAASPQRIRLAPPWESYNRTATGFAPLTENSAVEKASCPRHVRKSNAGADMLFALRGSIMHGIRSL